jgi:O-antigen ligase
MAILAASQARLEPQARWAARPLPWNRTAARVVGAAGVASLALALYITQQAAEAESKIVRATKIALTISGSGNPNDPQWVASKREMLRLLREGIAVNPHYRKITPMAADEMAKWGDWRNATWVWESVLGSRPYIVAILCNVARGYAMTGEPQKAWGYLERAKKIQPQAPAVRSLEVVLLARSGETTRALEIAKLAMAQNAFDYDLVNAAFVLGWRSGDRDTAMQAMQLRMQHFPETRAAAYMQLGHFHAAQPGEREQALAAFRQGLALATERERPGLLAQVPAEFQAQLR